MTIIFAQINESNEVININIWDESILGDPASEETGKNYLANFFGVSSDMFIQTFDDGTRKQQAGVGYTWDSTNNVFIIPKPFASWTLDGNYDWQPPVVDPNTEGYLTKWNETDQTWDGLKTSDNSVWKWNTATNQWDSV
jgi:hypothetical protein|tara:strand:- start:4027 stop:4443 length:417 start_codon:yes stop_codon:yes gene_type:complete